MATLKEAREALDYLQGRIDAGSMVGERLAVIEAYFNEMLAAAHKLTGTTPTTVIVDEATEQDRKERRAPTTTITLTGSTLTFLPSPSGESITPKPGEYGAPADANGVESCPCGLCSPEPEGGYD